MFHDRNYLKGDNYGKNKEKVANRFNRKLSKYNSNNMPLEFIGYSLPDISFQNYEFSEPLYFNEATFYRVRFSEGARWGLNNNDKFKTIDERKLEKTFLYIFRWNNVPKNYEDNHRLRNFLNAKGIVEGAEDLQFVKVNRGETISMTCPGSNYTLSLNNEKTKATLKDTTGNKLYEFTVKGRFRRTVYPLHLEEPRNLASIKAVYRSLRDNYEYRMRYDESSQFFTHIALL
jgi:hypothetical protein